MKKIIFALLPLLFATIAFAQSEKYVAAMQPKVIAVDTTHSIDALVDLGNAFERIADAEKTQWLPYYYAALANIDAGNMTMTAGGMNGGMADKLDPYADKAETFLNKAEALSKDNSEIFVLRKMIATLRMMGDPMSRYMTYAPEAADALATAKKLNPENPRIFLLEGIDKFYTPEQYGGSKEEARKLFEQASQKFASFKPETSIHPTWGQGQVNYFMTLVK
jgi:hypothetical protein